MAAVVHANGSKAVMQINHAGSAAAEEIIGTVQVGPSTVSNPRKGGVPRELTSAEINGLL